MASCTDTTIDQYIKSILKQNDNEIQSIKDHIKGNIIKYEDKKELIKHIVLTYSPENIVKLLGTPCEEISLKQPNHEIDETNRRAIEIITTKHKKVTGVLARVTGKLTNQNLTNIKDIYDEAVKIYEAKKVAIREAFRLAKTAKAPPQVSKWYMRSDNTGDEWFEKADDNTKVVWELPEGGIVIEDTAKVQANAKAREKTNANAREKANANAKAKAKANAQAAEKAQANANAKAKAKAEAEAEAEAQREAQAQAAAEAQAKAKAKAKAKAQAEASIQKKQGNLQSVEARLAEMTEKRKQLEREAAAAQIVANEHKSAAQIATEKRKLVEQVEQKGRDGQTQLMRYLNNAGLTSTTETRKMNIKEATDLINDPRLSDTINKALNIIDNNGQTPLMLAAKYGFKDIVNLILTKSTNIDTQDIKGNTALMLASLAIDKMSIEIVNTLIEKGANIQLRNNNGNTALMCACSRGHLDIATIFIHKGDDLSLVNNKGNTALMLFVTDTKTSNIDIFLNSTNLESWINTKNKDGESALTLAIENNNSNFEKILNESDINTKITREYVDKSLLYIAAEHNNINALKILLKMGKDPNEYNKYYNSTYTPLIIAAKKGYVDIVETLLAKGANPMCKDKGNDIITIVTNEISEYIKSETISIEKACIEWNNIKDEVFTPSSKDINGNISENVKQQLIIKRDKKDKNSFDFRKKYNKEICETANARDLKKEANDIYIPVLEAIKKSVAGLGDKIHITPGKCHAPMSKDSAHSIAAVEQGKVAALKEVEQKKVKSLREIGTIINTIDTNIVNLLNIIYNKKIDNRRQLQEQDFKSSITTGIDKEINFGKPSLKKEFTELKDKLTSLEKLKEYINENDMDDTFKYTELVIRLGKQLVDIIDEELMSRERGEQIAKVIHASHREHGAQAINKSRKARAKAAAEAAAEAKSKTRKWYKFWGGTRKLRKNKTRRLR
jgi:ankyrin repeat protein